MFHVITPLVRFENVSRLMENIKRQRVFWHVITDDDNKTAIRFYEPFVRHYICPNHNVDFWARCNNSINWFIETQSLNEEDYYCVLNDDDSYEDDFFESLRNKVHQTNWKQIPNDLIITSMKRGHLIPADAPAIRCHPPVTLYASPENIRTSAVGVEQFFIKGKHLKHHRMPLTAHGDGEFIIDLVRHHKTLYVPDLYVLFNYLEPGRYITYNGNIDTLEGMAHAKQDIFVLMLTQQMKGGSFLEIGAMHAHVHNSTFLMEKLFEWRGVLVEEGDTDKLLYHEMRPKAIKVFQKTTEIDYVHLLEKHNFQYDMEYLRVNNNVMEGDTLRTLELLDRTVFVKYTFAVIVFKHDIYLGDFYKTREMSRMVLERRGYVRVFSNVCLWMNDQWCPYEDWYVHPRLVDPRLLEGIVHYPYKPDPIPYVECLSIVKRIISRDDPI